MRVLITTVPFASQDRTPINKLEAAGIEYLINPLGRKLKEEELAGLIPDFDCVIAGTEQIGIRALKNAQKLKLISRVGVGLDSVDLLEAKRRGVKVSYTPDAPAPAVAELTLGLMLSLLRSVSLSNKDLHSGKWSRYFGRRLSNCTVGIIGAGRIGSLVIKQLGAFGVKSILVSDLDRSKLMESRENVAWADNQTLFEHADILSVHLPLTSETRNLITSKDMLKMKDDAIIINTSRGGIINENDLFEILKSGHLGGAAVDVFEKEPYEGPLATLDRCVLTAHMGSMTLDCRIKMEVEATQEVIRFCNGEALTSPVPEEEYDVQRVGF
ncbi:phosphoglycerate dehydrogenase [bacterium]|nr:phosphoglycerate dehydrogenase [bacterium]